MRDCVKKIVELSEGKIDAENAKEILNDLDRRAKKLVGRGMNEADAIAKVAADRAKISVEMYAKQKANVAQNLLIKRREIAEVNRRIEQGLTPDKAFQSILETVESNISGTGASFDGVRNALETQELGRLVLNLEKEGLLNILTSDKFGDEIGEAIYQLSNDMKPTVGDRQTQRVAEILYDMFEQHRIRMVEGGADIQKLPGWALSQRHDDLKIRKVARDEYANFTAQLLDPEKSFDGASDMFDVLRGAYDAITTGIRLNDPFDKPPKLFQFTGPANLAKRLSHHRKMVFKDYASWKLYNERFGVKGFSDSILDEMRSNIFNIAMLERFGTNPEAMMREIWSEIKKKNRDAFKKHVSTADDNIDNIINYATGKMNVSANPTLSKISGAIGVVENVTRLGNAGVSSLTDSPLKALEYQYQGQSFISSVTQAMIDEFYVFKSREEKMEYLSLTLVGMEGHIGDVSGRFSANDDVGVTGAKINRTMFKLNFLAPMTDGRKQSMGRVMAHHLGLKKDTPFNALDEDTIRNFGLYNITETDWDVARAAARQMSDGRYYVGVDAIKDRKVAEKFSTYFVNRVEHGVIEPGARERRYVKMNTRSGTPLNFAVTMITRFKTFPTAMTTRVWGRALHGRGKADTAAMLQLVLMMTAAGYAVGALKDLQKGRTPKDPTNPETILAAMAQGGAVPIYADVLLQDTSGFGSSLAQATFGPTYGRIEDIFKIYSQAKKGEFAESQAVRAGMSFMPGTNLPYTISIYNYLMQNMVYEQLNPGYNDKMERNLKKTYGQELLFN